MRHIRDTLCQCEPSMSTVFLTGTKRDVDGKAGEVHAARRHLISSRW